MTEILQLYVFKGLSVPGADWFYLSCFIMGSHLFHVFWYT